MALLSRSMSHYSDTTVELQLSCSAIPQLTAVGATAIARTNASCRTRGPLHRTRQCLNFEGLDVVHISKAVGGVQEDAGSIFAHDLEIPDGQRTTISFRILAPQRHLTLVVVVHRAGAEKAPNDTFARNIM